jgi:hypothetical protein
MVMTDYQSVAANTTTGNILAGKNKEFLEEPSIVAVGVCAAAIGMRCTVVIGSEVVVDDQEVSAANHMPIFPEDVLAEGGGFGGDRITVRLRNTTAGAIVAWTKLNISPA